MSQENFENFRKLVLQETSLQKLLRHLSEPGELAAQIIKLGAERGFEITSEDVEEAMRAARRAWFEKGL